MTARGPDAKRRMLPRWRASNEAIKSGEARSLQPRKQAPSVALASPHFESILAEWQQTPSLEIAADVVSSAVALGRTDEKNVYEAAKTIEKSDAPAEIVSLARRLLAGTIGSVAPSESISFDPDRARAELQSQIALHKRRVRAYPQNALAWADLARLYTALGQQQKAKDALRIATNQAPNDRFVLRSAARFFVHADGKNREENLQEGLDLLRKTRLLRTDPWIMAAEISLSTLADDTARAVGWARQLADADTLQPWDSSELNGALATVALEQGGLGKPAKLFNKSLRAPTENALAQAQWAADAHKIIAVPEQTFATVEAPPFEALALRHRAEGKWQEVIEDCRAWSAMEPTSTRPLIMGSFVAEVALEDGAIARDFSERVLLIAPNEPWAHNNLAVALAYVGKIEEAEQHASRFSPHEVPEEIMTHYIATKGLIAYRRGNREEGLKLYLQAAENAAARKDIALRAMVMWHLLREESRVRAPGTQELADQLWKRTDKVRIPELQALRQRILKPAPTFEQRVAALVNSVVSDRTLPPAKDVISNDFRKLFDE